MVLIDVSSKWSHVCLLSSQNIVFAKLITYIIRPRTQFPDNAIKKIRLDNAGKCTSYAFDNFYTSIKIDVEYLVAHIYTQNVLAESFIKCLQLIIKIAHIYLGTCYITYRIIGYIRSSDHWLEHH
jgi:hypothetical protein